MLRRLAQSKVLKHSERRVALEGVDDVVWWREEKMKTKMARMIMVCRSFGLV